MLYKTKTLIIYASKRKGWKMMMEPDVLQSWHTMDRVYWVWREDKRPLMVPAITKGTREPFIMQPLSYMSTSLAPYYRSLRTFLHATFCHREKVDKHYIRASSLLFCLCFSYLECAHNKWIFYKIFWKDILEMYSRKLVEGYFLSTLNLALLIFPNWRI